jgi:thiamine biosynthesis lipoprotein
VWGDNWTGRPWVVEVQDPRDRVRILTRLELAEGAIATSSVLGHTWTVGDRRLHHLIDPSTGQPSDTDVLSVTTTSSELWWAEIVAKVAVLAGSKRAPSVIKQFGCSGVVLDRQGNLVSVVTDPHDVTSSEVVR